MDDDFPVGEIHPGLASPTADSVKGHERIPQIDVTPSRELELFGFMTKRSQPKAYTGLWRLPLPPPQSGDAAYTATARPHKEPPEPLLWGPRCVLGVSSAGPDAVA